MEHGCVAVVFKLVVPLEVCSDEYATEFEKKRGNQAKEHNFENAAKTHNNSSD